MNNLHQPWLPLLFKISFSVFEISLSSDVCLQPAAVHTLCSVLPPLQIDFINCFFLIKPHLLLSLPRCNTETVSSLPLLNLAFYSKVFPRDHRYNEYFYINSCGIKAFSSVLYKTCGYELKLNFKFEIISIWYFHILHCPFMVIKVKCVPNLDVLDDQTINQISVFKETDIWNRVFHIQMKNIISFG